MFLLTASDEDLDVDIMSDGDDLNSSTDLDVIRQILDDIVDSITSKEMVCIVCVKYCFAKIGAVTKT